MNLTEDYVRELGALTGAVLGQQDLRSTLVHIAELTARIVPGSDAASISTFEGGQPTAVAFSDDWAKELDEMQYTEREGPCLDASRTGNLFRIRDMTSESRWPAYVPRAAERGAQSMVSIPLQADGRNIGALNLYARTPDAFTAEAVALAEILAAHAGVASQVAASFFRHRDLAEQMREAMKSRSVIDQALGVLMAQRRITADAAFTLLRQSSQRLNVKLRILAQEVVDTGELRTQG